MTAPTLPRRLADWPARLDSYVHALRQSPFRWGALDCVTFAAGAVQAITGQCPAHPQWVSERSAARALRRAGGLHAAVSALLPELPAPTLAQRGDVLLVRQPGRDLLAVCLGDTWAAPGRNGLHFGPICAAVTGWKVGC